MLQPLGPGLVIAFRTAAMEKAAKKRWKLTRDEASVPPGRRESSKNVKNIENIEKY